MTLTKAHIVQALAEQNGYPNKQSFETIETLLEIIKRTLESAEDVMISGFGKFCIKEKKQRRGRNPANGEDMMLEPRKIVTFRCSRQLRDKINGKKALTKQFNLAGALYHHMENGVASTKDYKGCINSAKKNYLTATNS